MILRKTVPLSDYLNWDMHLNRQANKFESKYGKFPNIALMNDTTLDKINTVARAFGRDNFQLAGPQSGSDSIRGFSGDGYSLDFFIDSGLADMKVVLIYDSDIYSEETIPDADNI